MTQSNYYEVEDIIDKRINKGKPEYLIKWKGYSTNESTWEPLSHLKYVKDVVHDFETKRNKDKNINNKKNKYNEDSKENRNKENKQFLVKKRNNSGKEIVIDLDEKEKLEEPTPIFKIDQSFKRVLAVKLDNKDLIAIAEKKNKKGEIIKEYISTDKIKKINPWILIEYYESKIKFL